MVVETRRARPLRLTAVTDVAVFDPRSLTVEPSQTLMYAENIVWVGPMRESVIPPGCEVVSGVGATALPGLIDGHAHLTATQLQNYLVEGITTVRDVGNDLASVIGWRTEEHGGAVHLPRVCCCGPFLQSNPPAPWAQPSVIVTDPEQASDAVDELADAGVDAVKIYLSVHEPVMARIIKRAHERGLLVTAHLGHVAASRAAVLGIDSIEHAAQGLYRDVVPADMLLEAGDRFKLGLSTFWATFMAGWASVDPAGPKVRRLVGTMVAHEVALTPTLGVLARTLEVAGTPIVSIADSDTTDQVEHWENDLRRLSGDWTREQQEVARLGFHRVQQVVGALHESGVKIVTGTDFLPTGALTQELELLVQSGLSPAEALRSATLSAAEVIGCADRVGTLEVGRSSDFLLVDGDPTLDIGLVRAKRAVIKRGVRVAGDTSSAPALE